MQMQFGIIQPISRIKMILFYSCGAIKQCMHQIHSELMKQIHLKAISGSYQHFTESAERWLGEISFSASWGNMPPFI